MIATNGKHMHILMSADAVGGVWTYAINLITASPQVRFTLAIRGPAPREDQLAEARQLSNAELVQIPGALEWMDEPWPEVERAHEQLFDLADRLRPDIIHLNDYSTGALPFAQPVLVVGHSCCLSWWKSLKGTRPPAHWNEYRRRVTAGLRSADMVVAPSRAMLSNLLHFYPPLHRVRVIYNGADAPSGPSPSVQPSPHDGRGPAPALTVLAAGRLWDEAKNLGLLLEAAPRIRAQIRIAGELRDEPDLPENVRMLGRLSRRDVDREMSRADIFVHPAKYEPFGLAPLEAALRGCALVLGDIPSLREIWDDAATYVNTSSAGALAEAINRLAIQPGALRTAQSDAQRQARTYSADRFARSYHELYRALRIHDVRRWAARSLRSNGSATMPTPFSHTAGT